MTCGLRESPASAVMPEAERIALAKRGLDAWARRDLDQTLACMSEDIQHTLNIDGSVMPIGASVLGKVALREKLEQFMATFAFDAFVVDGLKTTDDGARANILIYYRHIASGHQLNVRFRLVFRMRDGLIHVMEEYHDAAYVEAFMRLAEGHAPDNAT